MSILENLYYGTIHPIERSVKQDSDYRRFGSCAIQCEEELMGILDDNGKRLYDKLVQNRHLQMEISEREIFIDGFRLGAQMMLEMLTETDRQLTPSRA